MGGVNGEHFGRKLVSWESRPRWCDLVAVGERSYIPPSHLFLPSWVLKTTQAWVLIIQALPHTEGSWALRLTSQRFVSLTCKMVLLMRNMVMAATQVAVTSEGTVNVKKKICKLLSALRIMFYFSQSCSAYSTSCSWLLILLCMNAGAWVGLRCFLTSTNSSILTLSTWC